ncbi:MAG TPA: hypothetical protein VM869_08775 [Enhygromyxa sp.]|nr:hypothetical protein [Enhygromyxa sp.]
MAQSRYIYDQKGPWPQPNPLNYRLFSAVLHLPFVERMQWNVLVGMRYGLQMLYYTPVALFYGLLHPSPRIVTDHEFEERFDNTVFNKMIVPFTPGEEDPTAGEMPDIPMPAMQMPVQETQQLLIDRKQQLAKKMAYERFPEQMRTVASTAETRLFIADFSIFDELPTFPGTYAAGTTVLFKRDAPGARLSVVSIRINGLELTPADGDAWELAKLFTMQGATIRLVYSTHALLHFPVDAINAITKDRLPTNHVLFQLLIPHTDLQLVLDKTVQTSFTSPLMNHQLFPWCAHTGPVSGLVRTLEQLYLGVEDNPAYPAYHYKHPRRTEEKYVNFLEAYYQTILRFVQKVLAKVEDDDAQVKQWADYIAAHVPGFPDGDHIFERDADSGLRNLDWAVATFIWDVSVGHTTDHYNMGLLDINENPFRVRVPPPNSKDATFDRKALRRWTDFVRYKLFWRLFLTATTVYRLAKVRYPFEDPELRRYNDEFLADLKRTAEQLKGDEFIPLRKIARSVQF